MPTVLIVDDHTAMREAIRLRVEGCSKSLLCCEAIDGVDAIEQAERVKSV